MLQPQDLNNTPPGDWTVVAPEVGIQFRHFSIHGLLKEIRLAREGMCLHNGGEWIPRVYEAICQQNPNIPCWDVPLPEHPWNGEDVARFLKTLWQFARDGGQMVDEAEQQRRIAICKVCPKLGEIDCRRCGSLAEMFTEFFGERKLPRDSGVRGQSCMACGCDVTAKTAYPLELLQRVDAQLGISPEYADGCWMRQ